MGGTDKQLAGRPRGREGASSQRSSEAINTLHSQQGKTGNIGTERPLFNELSESRHEIMFENMCKLQETGGACKWASSFVVDV